MSKPKVNTREIILDKALEMFNERGIEYVGLRELAAVLGIRVSNITYYFPTKDDLVYELSQQLSAANAALMVAQKELTMKAFLEMLHLVYQNHIRFRCLLLSVVHLMQQNKHLAVTYKQTQKSRNATLKANLKALEKGGYLKLKDESELSFLVSTLSLISRFWISEASISLGKTYAAEQVRYYQLLVTQLFGPYSTAKGKREMEGFLEQQAK